MVNPNFNIVEENKEKGYSRFVFEPLEPGFGNTLGVSLRRVLLTSIEGAAVTSVSVTGVKHMFSTLPGLKEDIIELILNIKALKVKLADGVSNATITLSKTGPGEVTAGDIKPTDTVEIVEPEHYLGSLSDKKSKLEIEMTVERGLGYSLAEERKISTVGVIPIDAIYTPIIKVNHKVEQTRVGRQTNYDKLILEVWTDETVDAREVLNQAAQILVSYFTQVYAPREEGSVEATNNVPSSIPEELLNMTIDELDLPTRIYNSLRNAGIETIRALLATPRRDLMGYRNLGAKSLSIIDTSLKEKGVPVEF